jgi:hypothetical protein
LGVETITIAIKPKKSYPGEPYRHSVNGGQVDVIHSYPTERGIQSGKDTYENINKSPDNKIDFRDDSSGHLALTGPSESLNLDFGTGLLLRTWKVMPHTWTIYSEAYVCGSDLMRTGQ